MTTCGAALTRAVQIAAPQVVMHQLTDLAFAPGTPRYEEGLERNAKLRIEGTRDQARHAGGLGGGGQIARSLDAQLRIALEPFFVAWRARRKGQVGELMHDDLRCR